MKLRYQRELYRALLCWDTGREETDFGYPLQMCLRNFIPGLLPCQGQTVDGKFCLCWDVTSRHSLAQAVGEGSLPVTILLQVMKALQSTMEAMEKYLVPCDCLALSPEWIYLDVGHEAVSFLCDFGEQDSFRLTLQTFGEFVLAHMDHQDPRTMRLGYGLYRLTVEDTFDRAEFSRLLEEAQNENTPQIKQSFGDEAQALSAEQRVSPHVASDEGETHQEMTDEQRLRHEALQSFFSEEEDTADGILPPGKIILLCGLAVVLGLLVMEGVVFFRSGHHLTWGWMAAGGVLFILALVVFVLLECAHRWRERKSEDIKRKENAGAMGRAWLKDSTRSKDSARLKDSAVSKHSINLNEPAAVIESAHFKQNNTDDIQQTVLLDAWMYCSAGQDAFLQCEDGKTFPLKGEHWLIGKQRTEVDICLEKSTVSRLHARIYRKERTYYIEDLNSRNGTRLEGQLINSGQPEVLKDGSEIIFADVSCTFKLF